MRPTLLLLIVIVAVSSCYTEDDYVPLNIEQVFVDHPEKTILVDIIYVVPSDVTHTIYDLDAKHFIKHLNGSYFHRYDIGLILGESKLLKNDELYDLKDNRGNEASVFLQETENSFKKDRLNIYIMKRKNTIAISGIGKDQRALITDEHIYKTTSPHEIGHALQLHHIQVEGNIMSMIRPHLRREFNASQVTTMKLKITAINETNTITF